MLSQNVFYFNTPTWTGNVWIWIGINSPNKLLHLGSGQNTVDPGCFDPVLELSYFSITWLSYPGNYCLYLALKTSWNYEIGTAPNAIPYSYLAIPVDLILEAGG